MTTNVKNKLNEAKTAASRPQDKTGNGEQSVVRPTSVADPMDSQTVPEGSTLPNGESGIINPNKIKDPAAHVDDLGGQVPATGDESVIDAGKGVKSKTPARNGDKLENGEKTVVKNPDSTTTTGPGNDPGGWGKKLTAMASKQVQTSEEVENLLADDELKLSEEFQARAKDVFNACVKAKSVELARTFVEEIEAEFEAKLEEETTNIGAKVDTYLTYSVKEWLEDNKVAMDQSLKNEITEEFITKLRVVFEESYIDVPEDKVNLVDELTTKLAESQEKLNEAENRIITFQEENKTSQRNEIISEMSDGLSLNQKAKFTELVKYIDFNEEINFRQSLEALKGSILFTSKKIVVESKTLETDAEFENLNEQKDEAAPKKPVLNARMQKYSDALTSKK